MNKPLAIFAPQVGVRSETFIRRHMQDLLPGGTVIVTMNIDPPYAGHWSVDCPILVLNKVRWGGLNQGIIHFISRKLGWRTAEDSVFLVVKQFLQEYGVQVILAEYLDFSLSWLTLAQKLDIPFFAHAHGGDVSVKIRDPQWQKEYLLYNQAAGAIAVSQASQNRLIEIGLEPSKIDVIPCGIDVPNQFVNKTNRETISCLAVGRMVPKKAPILLLDAFQKAVDLCPNLSLNYIGDGLLFSEVEQLIKTLNLSDKVTLHGSQPNEVVHQFMKTADIFLQHSMTDPDTGDEEGLPVAILEAMGFGLPVVSTRHAGIPEAVLDGETGFIVNEGDTSQMAERIVLLAQNLEMRNKLGWNGWQRAKELFTWEIEKNKLLTLMNITA